MFKLYGNTKETENFKCSVTFKNTVYEKTKISKYSFLNFLRTETLSLYKQMNFMIYSSHPFIPTCIFLRTKKEKSK